MTVLPNGEVLPAGKLLSRNPALDPKSSRVEHYCKPKSV